MNQQLVNNYIQNLIAADHPSLRVSLGDLAGLAFGQRVGYVARGGSFGQKGIADHLFIDAGLLDLDRHTCITQERGADLGAGGKDDLDSHVDNSRVAL